MIVTLTPNPSLDRTVTIGGELVPGSVHRIKEETLDPGGKGINVGLGVARAQVPTLAVFPAAADDRLLALLDRDGLSYLATTRTAPVRVNLAIISTPAITTKVNEPGAEISAEELRDLVAGLLDATGDGDQVMMCGALAPGMPKDLYEDLIPRLHQKGVWVGVDTADETLVSLIEAGPRSAPDFLKPNAHELGQIMGFDGDALEDEAAAGNLTSVAEAAHALRERGVNEVLVSLGPAGALLACDEGTWYSPSPEVPVISTVGAGDSSVAGYLIGKYQQASPPQCLALAVAYGAAAASMPGTTIPTPEQAPVFPDLVTQL